MLMPHSPEFILQLLQTCIKTPSQIKQIHSFFITSNHLLFKPTKTTPPQDSKRIVTLLYNTLIRAYLNINQPQNSLIVFTYMLAHRALPNALTFPSLIKAATNLLPSNRYSSSFLAFHAQALKRGVMGDAYVRTSLVSLYGLMGHSFNARLVFDEITDPCIVAFNAMIDAYTRNGDMGLALLIFKSMAKRDVVSWTSIINGFARNSSFKEAINYFKKMMENDDVVRPNEATYVCLISSCVGLIKDGGLRIGQQIHGFIVKNETFLSIFMGTALIDLYGKAGCLEIARRVFYSMEFKEVCTWNAMISSLASNGGEIEALEMFKEMKKKDICVNGVTFVAILTACSRAKLVEFGLELFHSMENEYGVVPIMEHYGCVVDLLGRAGLLNEAIAFIRNMPFEADASIFGALLGACKIHGNVDLGDEVGRWILELQPNHCGGYVVLSNIHAMLERWSHAADVRKAMVEMGIQKAPAYSTLDSL